MNGRNFDLWNRYLDNSGNILRGCIQINVKDGNTPAAIHDSDGNALQNPQITDEYGRSEHQIFIDDDVVAYFYKYIGTGSFAEIEPDSIDTSDESLWLLQYTAENSLDLNINITGQAAMAVDTMANLRGINPDQVPTINDVKVVTLLGYNALGDKEPINYVWKPNDATNDNGGSIVKSNDKLTGRWNMVCPTEHCDARHFGIMPSNSQNMQDQSTKITVWIEYCDQMRVIPYFSGHEGYKYYMYENLTLTVDSIDVAPGVEFIDNGSSTITAEWNGNPLFRNRHTNLICNTIKLSWRPGPSSVFDTMIIDDNYPVQLTNKNVILQVEPNTSTILENCRIQALHMIRGRITIKDCELREEWFIEGYDWSNLVSINNKILLDNFYTADTYIILKNKQSEPDYGDLGEQKITGKTLLANCIAENAEFSNVTLTGNTELHNISGTINLSGAGYVLNFVDCWLSITNQSNVVMDKVMWRRGSVTGTANIQPLTELLLENVDVNAPFYSIGVEAQMIDCSIRTMQFLFRDVKIIGCKIYSRIYQYPQYKMPESGYDGYYWSGQYFGNTFIGDGAKIMLAPITGVDYTDLYLGIETKICNNLSDHKFVDDSLWNNVTKKGWASTQDFRYQGNTGGCPVFEDEITYTMPYVLTIPSQDQYDYLNHFTTNVPGTTDSTGCWVVIDERTPMDQRNVPYDVYWILNFKNVSIPVGNLFRLPYLRPRTPVHIEAYVQVFLRPDDNENWPFYIQEFTVSNSMLQTAVDGNAQTATFSSYRPLKYHFAGIRYNAHDDVNEWRSSLTRALLDYSDKGASFAGAVKYRFKFDDFGKSTPAG